MHEPTHRPRGWTQAAQDAYGELLDHLMACGDCTDAVGCRVAQELRATYKAISRGTS